MHPKKSQFKYGIDIEEKKVRLGLNAYPSRISRQLGQNIPSNQ